MIVVDPLFVVTEDDTSVLLLLLFRLLPVVADVAEVAPREKTTALLPLLARRLIADPERDGGVGGVGGVGDRFC